MGLHREGGGDNYKKISIKTNEMTHALSSLDVLHQVDSEDTLNMAFSRATKLHSLEWMDTLMGQRP